MMKLESKNNSSKLFYTHRGSRYFPKNTLVNCSEADSRRCFFVLACLNQAFWLVWIPRLLLHDLSFEIYPTILSFRQYVSVISSCFQN